jgi:hypothetical protein
MCDWVYGGYIYCVDIRKKEIKKERKIERKKEMFIDISIMEIRWAANFLDMEEFHSPGDGQSYAGIV